MGWLSGAIEQGAAAGLLSGMWSSMGVLPDDARRILSAPNRSGLSVRERGLRDGLVETGHLRRRWWGRYEAGAPKPPGKSIGKVIDETIVATFAERPDAPLKPEGFRLAWLYALKAHWPNVQPRDAAIWLDGYLDVPIGTPGHDWTYSAAQMLARNYVDEFGEAK